MFNTKVKFSHKHNFFPNNRRVPLKWQQVFYIFCFLFSFYSFVVCLFGGVLLFVCLCLSFVCLFVFVFCFFLGFESGGFGGIFLIGLLLF